MYEDLRRYVLRRDGWRCRACGFRNNLQVHHIEFRSHGGEDTVENCATLCSECHDRIHVQRTLRVTGDNADIPGNVKFLRIPNEA